MDVQSEKNYDQIEKDLIKYYKEKQSLDDRNIKIKEKSFESITSAIGKLEGKISNVLENNNNLMNFVPFFNNIANFYIPETSDYSEESKTELNELLPRSTSLKQIEMNREDLQRSRKTNPKVLNKKYCRKNIWSNSCSIFSR